LHNNTSFRADAANDFSDPFRAGTLLPYPSLQFHLQADGIEYPSERCASGVSSNNTSSHGKSEMLSSVSFFCMEAGMLSTGSAPRFHCGTINRSSLQCKCNRMMACCHLNKPNDGTLENLPRGAKPVEHPNSTYFRREGGDKYEFAFFAAEDGDLIVVQADGVPSVS
jgi:hypothetical protein